MHDVALPYRVKQLSKTISILNRQHSGEGVMLVVDFDNRLWCVLGLLRLVKRNFSGKSRPAQHATLAMSAASTAVNRNEVNSLQIYPYLTTRPLARRGCCSLFRDPAYLQQI